MVLALVGALALASAAACGGSSGTDSAFPEVVTLGEGDVFPAVMNDSLGVGENRLLLNLTDANDELIRDAAVHLRIYDLNGDEPLLKSEADARFVPVEFSYVDEQAATPQPTGAGTGGVYVANVSFDRAGEWGLKASVTVGADTLEDAPFRFTVRDDTTEPSVGDPAPPSVQATVATSGSVEEIDSSFPPRPHMHDITIADALGQHRPLVIAFATPAYCRTRTCAPVMDTIMDPLFARYGGQATFIHVEPYVLRDLRAGFVQNAVPAAREWQIQSEPWIFIVGSDGRISAKFQGIMALDEVESALQRTLR